MESSVLLSLAAVALAAEPRAPGPRDEAERFLALYNSIYQGTLTAEQHASWAASTDVNAEHEGMRTGASQVRAAFAGDPEVIATAKRLLEQKDSLDPLQVRQLRKVLLDAAQAPGTVPELVRARVAAESRQAAVMDGFVFCLGARGADGTCDKPGTANDIDDRLQESRDLDERLRVWNASKEIGVPLKPGLVELVKLRNGVAREMGYSSYFGLMVADYGMTTTEMMALLDGFASVNAPLYDLVRAWATRELAHRYDRPVPAGPVPAHWYPNRWAQEWGGLVEEANMDPYFAGRAPESIVRQAEQFYVSLGFDPLPAEFWKQSDLYPVPAGDPRLKNAHASAWHIDLQSDVRSLMSVQPDSEWFSTAHHELGHIYYQLAYSRPEVPPILRDGANRAFHEGIGELAALASGQVPYLRAMQILPKSAKIDPKRAMLSEALARTVAFVPWSAGVMSRFEYELYEKELPPEKWQRRWWELVEKYQGVAPPDPARLDDPNLCDACTKTHINDDPAGYYDYAIATVLKYQLHEHICVRLLDQDPRECNYYGHREVGDYLNGILKQGATRDWRDVVREATGEDLSTRAMVAYYEPLGTWLKKELKRK